MNILDELEQHILSLKRISVKKSQGLYTQTDGIFEGISWEGYNKTKRAIAASLSEVEMLKAQVNQFKRGVESFNKTGSMNELLKAYSEAPEQCLAKVLTKAIECF